MYKLLKRNQIYKDNWLTFYQDEVEFPDGSTGTYAWTKRMDGVGIVVVSKNRQILLNHEYRYVIGGYSWEIPGGGIDDGETPEEAAKRELMEETGIETDNLKKITEFYPLHSLNTEKVFIFMAKVDDASPNTDHSENAEHVREQRFVDFDEVFRMIDEGEITDAMTVAAVQLAVRIV